MSGYFPTSVIVISAWVASGCLGAGVGLHCWFSLPTRPASRQGGCLASVMLLPPYGFWGLMGVGATLLPCYFLSSPFKKIFAGFLNSFSPRPSSLSQILSVTVGPPSPPSLPHAVFQGLDSNLGQVLSLLLTTLPSPRKSRFFAALADASTLVTSCFVWMYNVPKGLCVGALVPRVALLGDGGA